jgi:hypothetical protein
MASADSEVRPDPRPDPAPVATQSHGSRAGSSIHILPADSAFVSGGPANCCGSSQIYLFWADSARLD